MSARRRGPAPPEDGIPAPRGAEQPHAHAPAPTSASDALAPADADAPEVANGSLAETLTRRLHRLVLDVHDGPMQNLTVIGFSIGDLRQRMSALVPAEHHPKIDAGLERITDELDNVERELRRLINALEDTAITTVPLREAIESEIRAFQQHCRAQVRFVCDDDTCAETDSQRITLQSVTRAALSNVAKHAGATCVTVRLSSTPGLTTLEIEDDGCGFPSGLPPKQSRLGLTGMRRRVELLGGEFRVDSRLGGPTVVTASLKAWRPDRIEEGGGGGLRRPRRP